MTSLLLISIEGQTYGIREEEVRQIEDIPSLHRLPLSPACIAGMSIRDGRTVTLADLSVCIGRGPLNQTTAKRLLLVPKEGLIKGFVINGDAGKAEVAPGDVYPVPPYLATEVVDQCALIDSRPVPLVNLLRLYDRLLTSAEEAPAAPFSLPAASSGLSPAGSYRIFTVGGEPFALPSECVEKEPAQATGPIAALRPVPGFVRGLTWHRDGFIPVFDPAQRMRLPQEKDRDLMLVCRVQGLGLGLAVEEDHGVVHCDAAAVRELSPLAATSWFRSAIVHGGNVIPIPDLSELFSIGSEEERAAALPAAYTADASFSDRFGREEIDVTEFSLLGMRHAVPRSERKAIIGFRPFRPVPGTLPIVAGVAEYEQELLPVIDLATVFGRHSRPTAAWRMMEIRNGDFHALVLAENVFNDKRLGNDLQRPVPIALPHKVVYGCYLETEAVRLILNVHAMAVHFEPSLVEELLPVLGRQLEQQPEEPVTVKREEIKEASAATITAAGIVEDEPSGTPVSELVPGGQSIAADSLEEPEHREPASEPVTEEPAIAGLSIEEPPVEEPQEPVSDVSSPEIERAVEDREPQAVTEEMEQAPQPVHELRQEAGSGTGLSMPDAAEEPAQPAPEAPSAAIEEPEDIDRVKAVESGPETEAAAQEIHEERATEEVQAETKTVQTAEEPAPVLPADSDAQPAAADTRLEAPVAHTEPLRSPEPPSVSPGSVAFQVRTSEAPRPSAEQGKKRRWILYVAVALVIISVIGVFKRSDRQPPAPLPPAEPATRAALSPGKGSPLSREKETLVLEVPSDRMFENELYIVQPGDTLWDISGRFTGKPTNYPHIAGENRIVNPDLIFPDQKIRLKKKDGGSSHAAGAEKQR